MMKCYVFEPHHINLDMYYFPITALPQIYYSSHNKQYTYIFAIIVMSCFPLTVAPSSPSAISLLHCTGTEMVIGWRAPVDNGGDPVHGYYLDRREKSQSMWREVNVKPVKERVYTVSHSTSLISSLQWCIIALSFCKEVSDVIFVYRTSNCTLATCRLQWGCCRRVSCRAEVVSVDALSVRMISVQGFRVGMDYMEAQSLEVVSMEALKAGVVSLDTLTAVVGVLKDGIVAIKVAMVFMEGLIFGMISVQVQRVEMVYMDALSAGVVAMKPLVVRVGSMKC